MNSPRRYCPSVNLVGAVLLLRACGLSSGRPDRAILEGHHVTVFNADEESAVLQAIANELQTGRNGKILKEMIRNGDKQKNLIDNRRRGC